VRRPEEIPKRLICEVLLPGVEHDKFPVGRILHFGNKWANVHRWILHFLQVQKNVDATFVKFSIPKDTVQLTLDEDRKLSYLVGTAYVKFKGPGGKYTELPPESQNHTIPNATRPSESTPVKEGTETEGRSKLDKPGEQRRRSYSIWRI
jgi:hypothetical protein